MRTVKLMGIVAGALIGATVAFAQNALAPELSTKVDAAVADVLAKTSVPSASVGIVQGGKIVFTKAYGHARLDPPMAATAEMRYAIGSISKQFTAACLLLLQQEGKLSIDDPLSKYFPELTRSKDVTIRNILTHTSGYQDYAPQDYTIPAWTKPTTADRIIHEWATKPLDFEPGTQYQYSNTNFNIAGLIVEKVSGEKFWPFLKRRVLTPLGLNNTIDLDTEHSKLEPTGYMRNAFGPLRPAIMEAPGWYFADGEMAMPVGDLLTWDTSLMNQSLLSPASYAAMETDMPLKNGQTAHYGLGVGVSTRDGRRVVSYGTSSYGYDVRCASEFKLFTNINTTIVDPKSFDPNSFVEVKGDSCIIPPNSFALARTVEYFRIPRSVLTICLGKSTYARCGIIVNVTPLEPEWEGHVTLEFSNTTPLPARIYANEGVAQMLFLESDEVCETSYRDRGGKYQGQVGVTLPKT